MDLRDVQLAELSILKTTLAIMEKHHLSYYVLGGTLLGAVRHKGFIPWDDDIDIGLPRPDYETFLTLAEKELPSPMHLYGFKNGKKSSDCYFSKIVDESKTLSILQCGNKVEHPVWIDVFPLDGVPEGRLRFSIWKMKGMLLAKLLTLSLLRMQYDDMSASENYKSLKEKAIHLIMQLRIDKLLNTERIWRLLDQNLKQYDYQSSAKLINFCGAWHMKELFSKSIYGSGTLYPFEDIQVCGPENYDFVLTQMYGDYMTPPPNDQRNQHSIILD